MKLNNIILYLTVFLSIYLWVYDNFLYESLYVSYLPNYSTDIPYPVYDLNHKVVNDVDPLIWEEASYLPILPYILYKLFIGSMLLTPILFCVLIVFSIVITIKRRKSKLIRKWAIIQFSLMAIIFIVFTAVDIMD